MLTIPTYLKESPVHGIGVFCSRFVPEGTIVWVFNPLIDRVIRHDEMCDLPGHVKHWVKQHSWRDKDGHYHIGLDNDKYTNHASAPNTILLFDYNVCKAIRDIPADDELTVNYSLAFPYDSEPFD